MGAWAVDLVGEGRGDEGFQGGGGGGLVPGVHGGVERARGEVGGGGDGEWRAVQVGGAQRVGGVGGAFGEGGDEGAQSLFGSGAVDGQQLPDVVVELRRDGLGSARREWAAPVGGALVQGVEDGGEQRPQGVGALGTPGEGRRAAHTGPLRGWRT